MNHLALSRKTLLRARFGRRKGSRPCSGSSGLRRRPRRPLRRNLPAWLHSTQAATADVHWLLDAVPGPWDPIAPWMKTARLRDEDEIAVERERAEIRHWLIGAELLWRDSEPAARDEIERTIREVLAEAGDTGLLDMSSVESLGDAERPLASFSATPSPASPSPPLSVSAPSIGFAASAPIGTPHRWTCRARD